jgi:hypothetical protein
MLLVERGSSWEVSSLERNIWLDGCQETEPKAGCDHLRFNGDQFNLTASMMGGSVLCHF